MRPARQEEPAGPEVLRMIEVERPVPGPTEMLVEVVNLSSDGDLWH